MIWLPSVGSGEDQKTPTQQAAIIISKLSLKDVTNLDIWVAMILVRCTSRP